MGRADLATTFTKLRLWQQTQFAKIVYLDADTLPLQNLDSLFALPIPSGLAAAPELGFPDCFNSGVLVLTPSFSTFASLHAKALKGESFDGGDQGLLNTYFEHKWERLSFLYNLEMYRTYRLYMPAINRVKGEIKVVHFIGKVKPWDLVGGEVETVDGSAFEGFYREMVGTWWGVYGEVR